MIFRRKAFYLALLSTGFLWGFSCGGGGSAPAPAPTVLAISPAGPVVVKKGATQTFTANLSGTTWSVEGGDANGSIDSTTGVFTPPNPLPLNPNVQVKAEAPDGQTATAQVRLKAGDVLALAAGAAVPVNDDPVIIGLEDAEEPAALSDRLAVSPSFQLNAAWVQNSIPLGDQDRHVFFDRSVNLLGFGEDLSVTSLPVATHPDHLVTAVGVDGQGNPILITVDGAPSRIVLRRSSNGGESFEGPIEVNPSMSSDDQLQASLRTDGNGSLHSAYIFGDASGANTHIFYGRSDNGGSAWSNKEISLPAAFLRFAPAVLVSQDGQQIHACWVETTFPVTTIAIRTVRSLDGGANFSETEAITTPGISGCTMAFGPQGEVYLFYQDGVDLRLARSTDGGVSFPDKPKVNQVSTQAPSASAFQFLSVDDLGRIDTVWSRNDSGGALVDTMVYARSLDGGSTFSQETIIGGGSSVAQTKAMGLRHDEAGRLHILFRSGGDTSVATNTYDILYLMGE